MPWAEELSLDAKEKRLWQEGPEIRKDIRLLKRGQARIS